METKRLLAKYMEYILLVLFLSFCPAFCDAQKVSSLCGKIVDRNGEALPGATVLLFKKDSVSQKGSVANLDGNFYFADIPWQKYVLEVSMVGFEKAVLRLDLEGCTNMDVGNVTLEEVACRLNEVVVTGKLPLVRYEPGKVVVDVSSSVLFRQGSALELLKDMPGVIVREDGSISLYGQTGVQLLIDGRKCYLSGENLLNYLLSIPAVSVNQVELITLQSSAFDASGNAGVINISTKRNAVRGMDISLYSNYRQGKFAKNNSGFSFASRINKVNLYADYAYYRGKEFMYMESGRQYLLPGGMPDVELNLNADRRYKHRSHWGRVEVDFDVSKRLSAGVYASVSHYVRTTNETNKSAFSRSLFLPGSIRMTFNLFDDSYTNVTSGACFSMKLRRNGEWKSSFDFQNFDSRSYQSQSGYLSVVDMPERPETMSGNSKGQIRIYSMKSDFRLPLTEKTVLNAGMKAAFVSTSNSTFYERKGDSGYCYDESLSGSFRYREKIGAAYSQIQYIPSSSFSVEAGLRVEHTDVSGRQYPFLFGENIAFRQRYTNIFPSFMLSYVPLEKHTLSLIYGHRILRPDYAALNPAVVVYDNYLYQKGNAGLKPELCYNLELSYLLKKRYHFTLFYSYRKRPVVNSYVREEGGELVTITPVNIPRAHSAGMRIGFSNLQPLDYWTVHAHVSLAYHQSHWITGSVLLKNEQLSPNVYMSHRLRLPGAWTIELTGYYNGKTVGGQTTIHPFWSLSAGVRKSFFNDRLTVYAYVDDIFASNNTKVSLSGDTLSGWFKERRMNRLFGLTISYRFNWGSKIKESQQRSMTDESKRVNL